TLQLRHGPLRHQERPLACLDRGADAAEAAGTKQVARIREDAGDADRTRARVDLTVRKGDGALVFVNGAIAQQKVELRLLARFGHRLLGRIAAVKVDVFVLADGEIGLDRVHLRDRGKDRAWAYQVTDLHLRDAGNSIDQRSHSREFQVQRRLLDI